MMNFWTIEGIKPDADLTVLVITDQDERTMASWDGEAWITAEDEVPLSGTVTHWCLLEELPASDDIILENRRTDERIDSLREERDEAWGEYHSKCDSCNLSEFKQSIRCSDCCEMVSEPATVEMPDYRRLCPACAAKAFKEVRP